MANGGATNPLAAAIGQGIGQNMAATMGKQSSFLFCIPIQVGPASPYARNVRHWMHAILILQVVVCVLRFVWLVDILGGFWMLLLCGLGWYAWYEDMNITYVCMWGSVCAVNGLFDTLGLILPLIFDFITLQVLEIILRSMVPVSEFLGAAFSWHLYVDYYKHGGGADSQNPMAKWIDKMPDPMGRMVDEVDPEEATSLMRGIKKGAQNFDAHKSLDAVQHGMSQGSAALAGGFQAGSAVLRQGQGLGVATAAGQNQWVPGLGGTSQFHSLGGAAPLSDGGGGQRPKGKAPCC